MTVINQNSISGITSITAASGSVQIFNSDGSSGSLTDLAGVNVVGVVTATSFSGSASGLTGLSPNYWGSTDAGINTTTSVGIGTTNPETTLYVSGNSASEIQTLTDGATITPDFSTGNLFTVTLGGNRTLANPTNVVAGQSGAIFLVQDGTGSRTLGFGSHFDFAGGTAPTLTTTASAVDRIDYVVRTTTSIHTVFTANYS